MADIEAIRNGLAASLEPIPELAVSPYVRPSPVAPGAEIELGPGEYDKTMGRGTDKLTFIVRVFVANNVTEGAQKRLDRMLNGSGEYSVKEAVEADRTLAGACEDARVTKNSGHRQYQTLKGISFLGAEWTVDVFASGD